MILHKFLFYIQVCSMDAVARRGGDRGDKVTGPGAPAGSRGAREDQITCIEWGPGTAKLCAPEGPRKVVYGHDPAASRL
jgi:hypothetical protein